MLLGWGSGLGTVPSLASCASSYTVIWQHWEGRASGGLGVESVGARRYPSVQACFRE